MSRGILRDLGRVPLSAEIARISRSLAPLPLEGEVYFKSPADVQSLGLVVIGPFRLSTIRTQGLFDLLLSGVISFPTPPASEDDY